MSLACSLSTQAISLRTQSYLIATELPANEERVCILAGSQTSVFLAFYK